MHTKDLSLGIMFCHDMDVPHAAFLFPVIMHNFMVIDDIGFQLFPYLSTWSFLTHIKV